MMKKLKLSEIPNKPDCSGIIEGHLVSGTMLHNYFDWSYGLVASLRNESIERNVENDLYPTKLKLSQIPCKDEKTFIRKPHSKWWILAKDLHSLVQNLTEAIACTKQGHETIDHYATASWADFCDVVENDLYPKGLNYVGSDKTKLKLKPFAKAFLEDLVDSITVATGTTVKFEPEYASMTSAPSTLKPQLTGVFSIKDDDDEVTRRITLPSPDIDVPWFDVSTEEMEQFCGIKKPVCECGAEKAKTAHSTWCPKWERF